jgi:hypothetical protein
MTELITIHLEGGLVQDVHGLPAGTVYEVLDWDDEAILSWREARPYIEWILAQADAIDSLDSEIIEDLRDLMERIEDDPQVS